VSGDDSDVSLCDVAESESENVRYSGSDDLFGDYSVLGPGVHIVLDGRPVSRCSED